MTNFIRDYPGPGLTGTGEASDVKPAASSMDVVSRGVIAVYVDPRSGSGTQAPSVVGSAPWWAGRIVEFTKAPYNVVPDVENLSVGHHGAAREAIVIAPMRARALSLDFGRGITVDDGALVGSGDFQMVGSTFVYMDPGVSTTEADYLAPDTPEAIAASLPVEDAEWRDDEDDGPSWISLADVRYRGGGLMARLRPRDRGA